MVYRITNIYKVNIVARPVTGGPGVKGRPDIFVPAPPDAATAAAAAVTIAYQPPLPPGQVVTVAGPGWRQPPGELYVVLRQRPDTKVSVARLGGDPKGRYWPSVPRTMLTPVDPARITISPPPHGDTGRAAAPTR